MQQQQHQRSRRLLGNSEGLFVISGASMTRAVSRALFRRRFGRGKRSHAIAAGVLAIFCLLCLAYHMNMGILWGALEARGAEANKQGTAHSTEVVEPSPTTNDTATGSTTTVLSRFHIPTETRARVHTSSTTTTISAPPVPPPATKDKNIVDSQDQRTARPFPVFKDMAMQYEEGEYVPEEPHLLPGLQIQRRTFTPAELLERFGDADIIYSFVNGSEANHHYRKSMLTWCLPKLQRLENATYWEGGLPPAMQGSNAKNKPTCLPFYLKNASLNINSMQDFVAVVAGNARPSISDRETDELRHSVRSVEQHVQWHRGRVVIVSPGHHRGGVRVREARAALGHRVVSAMPAPACVYKKAVSVDSATPGVDVAEIARGAIGEMVGGVELPSTCGGGGAGLRVRGLVVDARTPGAAVRSAAALRDALAVPAQTLSLEDFRVVAVGPSEGDVVLVVSREDAEAKAVHWVSGASESDLLVTYPLPVEAYEDMSAEVRWSRP